ncbi:MAG: AraC family transcriptional regulator [Burkholderiaceae bacterium]
MPKARLRTSDDVSAGTHAERGVVTEGTLRCGPLAALPTVLDRLGADADQLLSEFGLTRTYFEDAENTVPTAVVGRLFHRIAQETRCDHFGVLLGRTVTLSALGAVGVLMQASPNVGHAIEVMGKHFHVHDKGAQLSVKADGNVTRIGYRLTAGDVDMVDELYTLAAMAGLAFLRALCGKGWRPLEFHLPFRRPRTVETLHKALGVPLKFDAEQLWMIFPAADLARPLPSADPLLYRMMAERIEQLEAQQRRDLVGRVRDVLQTLIFLEGSRASIVASRMGLSLRTLNRRLRERGESLQEIRDEVTAAAACQLLGNTEKSASEVALILGYSDSSAFTRAFRRWHGVPPTQWRSRKRRTP